MALLEYKLKSNRKVVVELLTGRTAVITSPACYVTENKEGNKISSISYEDQVTFKLGDEIPFKLGNITSLFKIEAIYTRHVDEKPDGFYLTTSDRTCATYFLLPLISKEAKHNWNWWHTTEYILNAYVGKNNSVIVETRYFPTDSYRKYEDKLKQHLNYLDFKDVNYYKVAYKFYIGDQHLYDLELFKHGKYSHMSEAAINKIKKFHKGFIWHSKIQDVLHKSPSKRKKMEEEFGVEIPEHIDLYSKPDLTIECYADII